MVICFIGIGSNLGDRLYYIHEAIKGIRSLSFTRVKKVSHIIETPAMGGPAGQNLYLNAVLEIETALLPYQLLSALQAIESGLGRVRIAKNGPRTIDLDILMYGETVLHEEALCLPHPRMLEREFVMRPLNEIAPEVCTALKKRVARKPSLRKRTGKKVTRTKVR